MMFLNRFVTLAPLPILGGCLFIISAVSLQAAIPWSQVLSVSNGPPAFNRAGMVPRLQGGGYVLQGTHPAMTTNLLPQNIPSRALFDDEGNGLWSAYLDTSAEAEERQLHVIPEDSGFVFASYLEGTSAHVGILNVTNAALNKYALNMALGGSFDRAVVQLHDPSRSTVFEDLGDSLHLLSLADDGSISFDKRYESSSFAPPVAGSEERVLPVIALPDNGGFIFSAGNTVIMMSGDPVPVTLFSNTVVTTCVNNDGSIRWAREFGLVTREIITPNMELAPDGSLYCLVTDSYFDFIQFELVSKSNLLKLNADGTLGWGITLSGVLMNRILFAPDGNLWLEGFKFSDDGSFGTDVVLLGLNSANGNLTTQAVINNSQNDAGGIAHVGPNHLYLSLLSNDGLTMQNQTSLVARVSSTFGDPLVRQYVDPASFISLRPDTDEDPPYFVCSPFDDQAAEAAVVLLDADLASLSDCDPFEAGILNINDPGLVAQGMVMVLQDSILTVTDATSTVVTSDMALGVMELAQADLCEGDLVILPPLLSLVPNAGQDGYNLEFMSQLGVNYEIQTTTDLETPFGSIDTVPGTGELIQYALGVLDGEQAFYQVQAVLAE
jgi:hypothetical protein